MIRIQNKTNTIRTRNTDHATSKFTTKFKRNQNTKHNLIFQIENTKHKKKKKIKSFFFFNCIIPMFCCTILVICFIIFIVFTFT